MIDQMLNVPGVPWKDLGTLFKDSVSSSREMIEKAKLNYSCSAHVMYTDVSQRVGGYHAIYRDDCMNVLGVVNNRYPSIVQNEDSFLVMEPMIQTGLVSVETVSEASGGSLVFGCFKLNKKFSILDDEVDHYFIVINDHLRPDGKVTVLNTPVRVVCQNTLSYALSSSVLKLRMPVFPDPKANKNISDQILESVEVAIDRLNHRSKKMYDTKIELSYIDKVVDELFPYTGNPDESDIFSKKNEAVDMMRDTFHQCLDEDNLDNYRGTVYYVYNALVDYATHYFKSADKGYDLVYKMNLLPGFGSSAETEASKVTKFLKMTKLLAA